MAAVVQAFNEEAKRFVASGAMNNMLQSQAVQGPSLLLTGLVLKAPWAPSATAPHVQFSTKHQRMCTSRQTKAYKLRKDQFQSAQQRVLSASVLSEGAAVPVVCTTIADTRRRLATTTGASTRSAPDTWMLSHALNSSML